MQNTGCNSAFKNVYHTILLWMSELRENGIKANTNILLSFIHTTQHNTHIHTQSHRKHNYSQNETKSLMQPRSLYLNFIVEFWGKTDWCDEYSLQHFASGLSDSMYPVSSFQKLFSTCLIWRNQTLSQENVEIFRFIKRQTWDKILRSIKTKI
jgi:hypothetical protein